jgi:hypothetical protein
MSWKYPAARSGAAASRSVPTPRPNIPDMISAPSNCRSVSTLIIADQVFEHLPWPYRAGRNALAMLKHGGYLIVTAPFLVKVHQSPIDCCRWTETGLSYLLQECGFAETSIQTGSWGNRACLKANLAHWRKRGFFGSLANEPNFPVAVWAFAQRLDQPREAVSASLAESEGDIDMYKLIKQLES